MSNEQGLSKEQELHRRWSEWVDVIEAQASLLVEQRHVWNRLKAVIQGNSAMPGSLIFDFMGLQYATSQSVTVRRVATDTTKGVISLTKLLESIRANPGVITPEMFEVEPLPGLKTDTGFHIFADATGTGLDVSKIDQDLDRLKSGAAQVIKHYVDDHVAHHSQNPRNALPNFSDLDTAIDLIEELTIKYALLVKQVGIDGLLPVIDYDWEAPLRIPWLSKGGGSE